MTETMATVQRKPADQPMEAVHESEREWEMLRFPGQWSKMLFHPRVDRPGGLPVDESDRQAGPGDDVPRGRVAVAEHLDLVAEIPAMPREPNRVRGRAERPGGPVQVA